MCSLEHSPADVIVERPLPTWREATKRYNLHYVDLTRSNANAFEKLDLEFRQIERAFSWLARQSDPELAGALLDLIKYWGAYLQRRALNELLLDCCHEGLRAAHGIGANPGWLHLLGFEAAWACGEWDQANADVQAAIQTTRGTEPLVHAQAQLALGRLQLNRGEYRRALKTLPMAEQLLTDVGDDEGVATAKAEIAAYYLNRGEYQRALILYQEVDGIRRRIHPNELSAHTLLMLGVVYRRLKRYDRAHATLETLIEWAQTQSDPGAEATGKHHLAWVYFDQGLLDEAEHLGQQARALYLVRNDPRGASDADEQLGLIALAWKDWARAGACLEDSLQVRTLLGNRHGVASSLRRLARWHFRQGHFRIGWRYLGRSVSLFLQLGMLSRQRLGQMILELVR